jgi:hypothetical protein
MPVNDALAGLNATEGDMIKGQSSFAAYTASNGWRGTLEYMQPGSGYMYQSAKSATFNYPATAVNASLKMVRSSSLLKAAHWTFNEADYQSNMTVTAVLQIDGVECAADTCEIGAFDANSVCRGSVSLQSASTGRYLAFLTVMGNTAGETLTLKAYNTDNAATYDIIQSITFAADAMLGTIEEPYVLSIGSSIISGIGEMQPANPLKAWVRGGMLHVEGLSEGKVWSIYNVSGALIYRSIADSEEADVEMPAHGVYMIQSEKRTTKVVFN